MGKIKTIAMVSFIVLTISGFIYLAYCFHSIQKQNQMIYTQLSENIAKVTASFVSKKELEKELSKVSEIIQKQIKQNKEQLKAIGEITATLKATVELWQESDKHYVSKRHPQLEYHFKKIYQKTEKGKVPTAWAMFYPHLEKWKTGTYDLDFYTTIVQTETENGDYNYYAQLEFTNPMDKETRDKRFPLKVKEVKWKVLKRKQKKFFLFNPKLAGGVSWIDDFGIEVGVFALNYGRTKKDLDFGFLKIGIGRFADEETRLTFGPIGYNLGSKLPLFSDLWIWPELGTTFDGNISFGIGITTNF